VFTVLGLFTGFWHERWWPLLPLTALAAWTLHRVQRQRLTVRREVQRIREQVARDLYDDIGSSLSKIALLSEVLRRRVSGDPRLASAVIQIGSLSREVLNSTSDTVWSLDPHRDTVGDTVQRMRDFAGDLFAARNIAFRFRAPNSCDNLKLGALVRRQLFLIFKEGVNNIARHAGCGEAEAELAIDRQWLRLTLADNGRGFDWDRIRLGHGLNSMQERSRSLGGQLQVVSSPGGTRVTLQVPRRHRPVEADVAPERISGK
jgi:signal transduction histidine kinase